MTRLRPASRSRRERDGKVSSVARLLILASLASMAAYLGVSAFVSCKHAIVSRRRAAAREACLVARACIASLKVSQLKEMLKEKGLPVAGKKADLVSRLEQAAQLEVEQEEEPATSYSSMKVADLKARCRELGLPSAGKKAELIARLEDTTTAEASQTSPAAVPAASQATDASDAAFLLGDKVLARHDEEETEQEAVVQRDNGDGTFLVCWTKDGTEHACSAESMKLKKRLEKPLKFSAGDAVEGLYHDEQKWYEARVKCISDTGSYTVVWDEDGEEYELEQEDMKFPLPRISLADLTPGQKLKGTARRTFGFGTFVDVGAERDGLVKAWSQHEGDQVQYKEGDKVRALYEDEEEPYDAEVQKDNGDGTYKIVWDEDGEEYTCDKANMQLLRVAALEEGSEVDVFVDSVVPDHDGTQRLALALIESKIGQKPPRPKTDLSVFDKIAPSTWLKGEVVQVLSFGVFVRVTPPEGGSPADGLVHITEIRDGFVENIQDEVEKGQEVDVCVKSVDVLAGRMGLSMRGC